MGSFNLSFLTALHKSCTEGSHCPCSVSSEAQYTSECHGDSV